jgi:hypothetical protein
MPNDKKHVDPSGKSNVMARPKPITVKLYQDILKNKGKVELDITNMPDNLDLWMLSARDRRHLVADAFTRQAKNAYMNTVLGQAVQDILKTFDQYITFTMDEEATDAMESDLYEVVGWCIERIADFTDVSAVPITEDDLQRITVEPFMNSNVAHLRYHDKEENKDG